MNIHGVLSPFKGKREDRPKIPFECEITVLSATNLKDDGEMVYVSWKRGDLSIYCSPGPIPSMAVTTCLLTLFISITLKSIRQFPVRLPP